MQVSISSFLVPTGPRPSFEDEVWVRSAAPAPQQKSPNPAGRGGNRDVYPPGINQSQGSVGASTDLLQRAVPPAASFLMTSRARPLPPLSRLTFSGELRLQPGPPPSPAARDSRRLIAAGTPPPIGCLKRAHSLATALFRPLAATAAFPLVPASCFAQQRAGV